MAKEKNFSEQELATVSGGWHYVNADVPGGFIAPDESNILNGSADEAYRILNADEPDPSLPYRCATTVSYHGSIGLMLVDDQTQTNVSADPAVLAYMNNRFPG